MPNFRPSKLRLNMKFSYGFSEFNSLAGYIFNERG
jgi:hypothetical protein